MKRVMMMVVAGCAMGLLTGCGVPQEEYDAKIGELNAAAAEAETLNGEIADLKSLLKAEQGKFNSKRIDLDGAEKRIAELEKKEAAAAKALADEKGKVSQLESDLAAAKSAKGMAQDKASELEAALAGLQGKYDKLVADFEQFKKNMRSLGAPVPASPAPAADDGESSSKTALDILDDMDI
ncbi:MAG: hypothetical protein ABFR33_06640 [Verrucomicrobiota bacterium]